MHQSAPGIEVTLNALSTVEQITRLYSQRIDLAFVRLPVPSAFSSMVLLKDRLALVSATNPRPSKKFSLADFRDMPFVAISEEYSPGFFHHMIRLCAKYDFHPRVVQEVPEYTTALALVRHGLGVTMIPESFWNDRFLGTRLYPLPDKEAVWSAGIAWRKGDTNPALARFMELLRKDFAII
jgi:DNA-binding transcriptional LysR family regulator